jgi:hypothetical protein
MRSSAKSCVQQKDDHGQIDKHKCCMIHLHDLNRELVFLAQYSCTHAVPPLFEKQKKVCAFFKRVSLHSL